MFLSFSELLDLYPEAKVILTVRDPETWYESVLKTIYFITELERDPVLRLYSYLTGSKPVVDLINRLANRKPVQTGLKRGLFEAIAAGRTESKQYYEEWVSAAKRIVPSERLLVFDVKTGWEPLCDFLGLEMPDEPFPRLNDTVVYQEDNARTRRNAYRAVLGVPVLALVLIGGIAFWRMKKNY